MSKQNQSQNTSLATAIPLVGAGIAAFLVLVLAFLFDYLEQKRFVAQQQSQVIEELSEHRAKLEMALNGRLHVLRGLAAYVKMGPPNDKSFAIFAKELIDGRSDIRSLTLAPGNVVKWVYPEANNRLALGVNLLEVPRFTDVILRTIGGNIMTVAGPHELVQGGEGLLGRLPIFWDTPEGRHLWGLAIIVLELPPLLWEAGIIDHSKLDFAIRGRDGLGAQGDVFYGDARLFDQNAVILDVTIASGIWQITARPKNGWLTKSPYQGALLGAGLVLSLLVGVVIYGLLDQGQRLKNAFSTLRQRESEFRTTMEAAAVGIFRAKDGEIDYVNRGMASLFGSNLRAHGGALIDLAAPADQRQFGLHLAAAQDGQSITPFQIQAQHQDGSMFPALITMTSVQTGADSSVVGSVVDLSDQAKIEAELRQAVDALLKSNEELERFAYVASHDLQEPLRSITSFAQLLDRRLELRLAPDEREFLGFIVAGAKRMHALVNDLLLYSRVTHQSAPFGPVALGPLMGRVLQNLHDSITVSKAEIIVHPLMVVRGDEVQLTQLFQNLIANSIKFSRPDQHPIIEISSVRVGEWAEITIADNGIGVPDEYVDQIFTIFKRLNSPEQYPGTGVGLAICRRITDRHGGRIWVEKSAEYGSRFMVRLPMHSSLVRPQNQSVPALD